MRVAGAAAAVAGVAVAAAAVTVGVAGVAVGVAGVVVAVAVACSSAAAAVARITNVKMQIFASIFEKYSSAPGAFFFCTELSCCYNTLLLFVIQLVFALSLSLPPSLCVHLLWLMAGELEKGKCRTQNIQN